MEFPEYAGFLKNQPTNCLGKLSRLGKERLVFQLLVRHSRSSPRLLAVGSKQAKDFASFFPEPLFDAGGASGRLNGRFGRL